MFDQSIPSYDSTNLDNNTIALNNTANNNNHIKYDNVNAEIGLPAGHSYGKSGSWRKPFSKSTLNTSASTSDLVTTSDDDSIKTRLLS